MLNSILKPNYFIICFLLPFKSLLFFLYHLFLQACNLIFQHFWITDHCQPNIYSYILFFYFLFMIILSSSSIPFYFRYILFEFLYKLSKILYYLNFYNIYYINKIKIYIIIIFYIIMKYKKTIINQNLLKYI